MEIAPPDEAVPGLADVLGRRVFAVGDVDFRWEDVLAAAKESDEWPQLEARAAEGAACERRAEAEGDPVDASEVGEAANAFRYERNLLSAEELEAWLELWGLDVDGWMAFMRRHLWRERWADDLHDIASRFQAPAEEVRRALWVDMVCSDMLVEFAMTLASRAAIHEAVEGSGTTDHTRLEESFRHFAERAVTPEALERLLATREMDWLMVECRLLTLPDEGMAREAALCVRDDGMSLSRVAEHAGAATQDVRLYLEDTRPPLDDMLVSSGVGELLGPLVDDGGFSLVSVLAKTRPSLEDPAIRARAASEVVDRAVEQEVINRVRWHERL